MENKVKYITEMSNSEAKQFLLKHQSYCSIELPKYFQFDKILRKIDIMFENLNIQDENINKHINKKTLKTSDSINCKIFANKDGQFDWRPLEIINPYIYVYLVRFITEKSNWENLINVMRNNSAENIIVSSIPVESTVSSKDKEEQILNWWDKVEQKSVEFALSYKYMLLLDISNCYGSIYTHSISWAIHGKETAKSLRNNEDLIGNKIDKIIRYMQSNQTNGIPQGSILMDFIAEIVLSYADKLLQDEIKKYDKLYTECKIIRYRDDYRIFSNSKDNVNKVAKALNDVLMTLNFKLNSKKTLLSEDVLINSIKSDKIAYQKLKPSLYTIDARKNKYFQLSLQKHLLQILVFSKEFPNSGSIVRMLNEFDKWRTNQIQAYFDDKKENYIQCISILTEIMINNTRTVSLCISIISKFLILVDPEEKKDIISKIKLKVRTLPNTDLINIWLQRLTLNDSFSYKFSTDICKLVSGERESIFDNNWIKTKKYKIKDNEVINIEKIETVISNEEASLFNY